MGMSSQLMWLRGDGDRTIPSLNFQGLGVTPWMQPRLDASMLGMQTDMYQAMAAAALREMRAVDPSKSTPSPLLQFQSPQNLSGRSNPIMQPHMLQTSHPRQQPFFQGIQENQHQSQSQAQAQTQSHLLQPRLQPQHSFNNNQQNQQFDHQQFNSVSQSQSSPLQAISSLCHQQSFSDSSGNHVTSPVVSPLQSLLGSFPQDESSSHLLNLPRTAPLMHSPTWPSKRAAIEPLYSSGPPQCVLPQVETMGPPQTNVSQNSVSLPPFPGKECSIDQEGSVDPQNHLLFGVNIENSSLLMPNEMSTLRGVGSSSDSTAVPFTSNYNMSTAGTDFTVNPTVAPSSCIDESGFLQSQENVGQVNPPNRTFVKVTCFSILFLTLYMIGLMQCVVKLIVVCE